jgi:ATP-binding cassette subfamily B protein
MSAAEQLDDARANKAGLPEPRAEPSPVEAQLTQPPATGRAKLRPLLALAPYVARYRGRAFLAFIALTVAALTTLVVPVAVRRMIDFGFSRCAT